MDEALEHGGDLLGFLDHLGGAFEEWLIESSVNFLCDVELGAKFGAGAFGTRSYMLSSRTGIVALAPRTDVSEGDRGWVLKLTSEAARRVKLCLGRKVFFKKAAC